MKPKEGDTNRENITRVSNKKGVNHVATVQKWGNSLAVRIPNQFAKNLGVVNGSEIELQLLDDEMIVRPVKTKPSLEDLLQRAKGKKNPHLNYDFGQPEGKEML